ncbi:MAG: Esterase, SGNH hydrolase-type [Candidatus Magnetoglobus multicellularis str. Araruama]|uniref:Esterase, SGNH hydrolase-type n=1 Tax=Candidatus Magnetoglobus multicellularis str. Araruama TaxID=890399 RepID=A0A1V1PH07_9BACT|nr:MAG: Esterase, SGNH hydrolase-type [Candidatus Magnetoglobus multicellularis str. Araruama]
MSNIVQTKILPFNQHKNPQFTVLFLGGSTTQCSYVQEKLRFPALVSTILNKNGLKVNTINSGRAGNTLHDSINIFFNYLYKFKPDYTVIMHATNDRGVLNRDHNYHSRMGQEVTFKQLLKWLGQSLSRIQIIGLLRLTITKIFGKKFEYTGISSIEQEKPSDIDTTPFYIRLKIFVNMVKHMGTIPILMTQPLANVRTNISPDWLNTPDQLKLNEIIRLAAKEQNVSLIDLSSYMKTVPDYENHIEKYLYDGIHVSDMGSKLYANYISKRLIEISKLKENSQ